MSYVSDHFFELVNQFRDPKSRTRRRLRPVYVDALQAMSAVMIAGETFWFDHPLPEVEESWRRELAGFLARGEGVYGPELVPEGVAADDFDNWGDLDPDGLALKSYAGLVEGRDPNHPDGLGASEVPDAALPSVMGSQIEILDEFGDVLGQSWWDKLVSRVSALPWPDPKSITDPIKQGGQVILIAVAVALGLAVWSHLRK